VALANEVLDAMPVARVRRESDGHWCELHVTASQQEFDWRAVPVAAATPLAMELAAIEQECGLLPAGYTTEVNLRIKAWFRSFAESVARGAAFIFDYGYPRREYYHPQRTDGTLLCHYRHRAHSDPFILVGLQDITASVDFTAAAEAAQVAGFEISGYTSQAHFLLALGLTNVVAETAARDPAQQLALAQQAKQLTLPGEMGERFKVLALSKNVTVPLQGFSLSNQLHRL